jgi:hypothetical protein
MRQIKPRGGDSLGCGDSKFSECRKFGPGPIQNLHQFSVRSDRILKEINQFSKFVHYRIRLILLNVGKIRLNLACCGAGEGNGNWGMEEEQGPHTPQKLQNCTFPEGKWMPNACQSRRPRARPPRRNTANSSPVFQLFERGHP